jgi:hypothetical protein
MLLVETELAPSPIHGIGAFLLEPVRAGQVIWRFDDRIDRVIADDELRAMPARLRDYLLTYSAYHVALKLWVLCGDNGRHFNHSDEPNTLSLGIAFGDDIAASDLPAGTELTTDYRSICDAFRRGGYDFAAGPSPDRPNTPPGLFDYQPG